MGTDATGAAATDGRSSSGRGNRRGRRGRRGRGQTCGMLSAAVTLRPQSVRISFRFGQGRTLLGETFNLRNFYSFVSLE